MRFGLVLSFGIALLGVASLSTVAQSGPESSVAIVDDDPAPLLGLKLDEAFSRFGAPSSVYPLRGEEAWQDDVAFVYAPGYSFFWYGDRLWQVRFATPYAGSVYGLFLGDDAEKAYATLGTPYESEGEALVYRLPYKGYPVRLRLIFKENRLADLYLYRADF